MVGEARRVAGRYGYMQVIPTRDERARGYQTAWIVIDMSKADEDGNYEIVRDAACEREYAIAHARELHDYERRGGEALHRLAIREWVAELTA